MLAATAAAGVGIGGRIIFRGESIVNSLCLPVWVIIVLVKIFGPHFSLIRSSSFERHKRRERERENYFRPENDRRDRGDRRD